MNGQRAVGMATVGLLLVAVLGVVWLLTRAGPPEVVADEVLPEPAPVRGSTLPERSEGPMRRVAVPRPPDMVVTEPTGERRPTELTTEQWRDYNLAVDDVIREARDVCLRDWARSEDKGRVEIIFDAVLWDGVAVDFGIRGLGDIPDHVLDCVADIAWQTPFPEHRLPGEIRLQRPIQVDGRAPGRPL